MKVVLLGQIPGNIPVICKMASERQHSIDQNHGIDQRQMIGTDNPWTAMPAELLKALPPNPFNIPDPVTSRPDDKEIKRNGKREHQTNQPGLKSQKIFRHLPHGKLTPTFA